MCMLLFRGDRATLEMCQQIWYADSNNPQEQADLACQLWGDGPESGPSYLTHQCSRGYEGPVCTICSPGHGVSGNSCYCCHACVLPKCLEKCIVRLSGLECALSPASFVCLLPCEVQCVNGEHSVNSTHTLLGRQ
jgi:hypothetical protein